MTDKPTPTDAEILDAAEDFRSQYTHGGTTFDEFDEIGFTRAVLAKRGQHAVKGYPVAWMSPWRKDQVTTDYDAYGKQGIPLYAAPQPVAREPLTDEQTKALMQAHRTAMLMTCKARAPECGEFAAIAQDLDWLCESLGIKGGQHGTE